MNVAVSAGPVKVERQHPPGYPDGVFGPVTQVHVINFQSHHGLTADGIVGSVTARALGP